MRYPWRAILTQVGDGRYPVCAVERSLEGHSGPDGRLHRVVVAMTDCRADWLGKPTHYPDRGFVVDLEVQYLSNIIPAVHKERWFPTLGRAAACAVLFWQAADGCSADEIVRVAREHRGRMT